MACNLYISVDVYIAYAKTLAAIATNQITMCPPQVVKFIFVVRKNSEK